MKVTIRFLVCLTLALVLAMPAAGQIQMRRSVLGGGGGVSSGAGNSVNGTLAQAVVGVVSGAGWLHEIGFWHGPPISTGVDESAGLPTVFNLGQNQPNPFNPTTTIRFAVPEAAQVTIRLFDIRGRLVRNLMNEALEPGYHEFVLRADGLSSGVYFYRMEADDFGDTKKLVLLK